MRSQYRQAVNVWAGMLGHRIIGPFFIDGSLMVNKYLNLLQDSIGPAVADTDDELYYQHDGCPAHNSNLVRDYLNYTFPNIWIGRGGVIKWPARSLDLSPNYFFLMGTLKKQTLR